MGAHGYRRRPGSATVSVVRTALAVVTTASLLLLGLACAQQSWRQLTRLAPGARADVDSLLLGLAELALAVVLAWLALALFTSALAMARPGSRARHVAQRVTPRAVRGLLVALLSSGLASASAAGPGAGPSRSVAASAVPAERGLQGLPDPAWAAASSVGSAADPGWTPTMPPTPSAPAPALEAPSVITPAPREGTAVEESVVVRRGDTLWSIAARYLGGHATNAEIASEWPRWYAANRAVIGADPHLVRAGQLLQPPVGQS